MICAAAEELGPVSLLPEAETFHVLAVIAHWWVPVRGIAEVHLDEVIQVVAHDLVRVDKDHTVQIEGKEYVQEEDFVRPDHALLLGLRTQPTWPSVRDHLIFKLIGLGQMRDKLLERGREEVLDEPKLD